MSNLVFGILIGLNVGLAIGLFIRIAWVIRKMLK